MLVSYLLKMESVIGPRKRRRMRRRKLSVMGKLLSRRGRATQQSLYPVMNANMDCRAVQPIEVSRCVLSEDSGTMRSGWRERGSLRRPSNSGPRERRPPGRGKRTKR